MGDCPIIGKDVPLTEKEVEKFCSYGCSVDCEIFLAEYIEKRDKKARKDDKGAGVNAS